VQNLITILPEYRLVLISSFAMAGEPVLNRDTALSLLCPTGNVFVAEDLQHSWSDNSFPPFETPFLRIWDYYSGSKPDDENLMMSRAPRQRFDTLKSRRTSLTTHINHSIWEPTPYISFTTSLATVQDLADLRTQRRGAQTLTVLDPNARIAEGLPILDIRAEMDHYGITDPYGKSNQYYTDHYVCLWEVTEREIIGHWPWDDLVAWIRGCENITYGDDSTGGPFFRSLRFLANSLGTWIQIESFIGSDRFKVNTSLLSREKS
jgi:hypothetical protein